MPGLNNNEIATNNLRHAGDMVLIEENQKDLQNRVTQINTKSQKYGMEINNRKTNVMIISIEEIKLAVSIKNKWRITRTRKKFQIIKTHDNGDGKCEREISRRMRMAKQSAE